MSSVLVCAICVSVSTSSSLVAHSSISRISSSYLCWRDLTSTPGLADLSISAISLFQPDSDRLATQRRSPPDLACRMTTTLLPITSPLTPLRIFFDRAGKSLVTFTMIAGGRCFIGLGLGDCFSFCCFFSQRPSTVPFLLSHLLTSLNFFQ